MSEKETQVEEQQVSTVSEEQIANMELVKSAIEGLEDASSTGIDLNKVYLEMEKGQVQRFVKIGNGEFFDSKSGELKETIELMNSKKQIFFSMSTVIVNSLRNNAPGTKVEVTCLGQVKIDKERSYINYSIELLN